MIYLGCMFFFVFGVVSSMQIQKSSDVIGFPEMEENALMANKQNRQPVYIPSICKQNELLYPGDQVDDWICDCRPGHLYHPSTDICWPGYRRGPCQDGEHIVLPDNSVIPECVRNPCYADNFVLWNGKCEELGSKCGENFPVSVLSVDALTFKINCVTTDVESRFALKDKSCFVGSRRHIKGKC